MIKLSIEEKAKAYDEALERAQALYNDKNEIGYANAESVLEEVFPLLKESEDERIRKELIEHCRNTRCVTEEGAERIAKWISWLEKQEGCEYIKKDWLEHIKQSWYKEGFIDGKYTPKELTINDVATLNELIDFLENGTEKLQHDLTLYANWLKTQFPTNEKQGEQKLPIKKLPSEMKSIGESLGFTSQEICDKYNQMVSDLIMSDGNEIKPKFKVGDTIRLKNSTAEYTIESISGGCYHGRGWGLNIIDADKSGDYVLVEQKPTDKVEPKFKIGDWVVFDGETLHITNVTENGYSTEDGVIPFRCEKETKLWTIADAKGGDVLTNGDFPCIFKRCDDNGSLYVYCGINAHNDFSILSEDPENVWDDYSKQYFPATKEQRDLLFQKMKEAGYEWDAEKKELKKIEDEEYNGEDYGIDSLFHAQRILEKTLGSVDGYQTDDGILSHQCAITAVKKLYEQKPAEWKQENVEELSEFENAMMHIGYSFFGKRGGLDPNDTSSVKVQAQYLLELAQKSAEWSEENEHRVKDTIYFLETAKKHYASTVELGACIDWLKSLKDRYTWKPSDEQIKQLGWIAKQNKDNMIGKELISLYQDLKKLREE